MATKLDLSLSASLAEGDHALICLVGGNGELVPSLDMEVLASDSGSLGLHSCPFLQDSQMPTVQAAPTMPRL